MRLAYLLNSYPMTSTTFIRREIAAIEAAGVPVKRFAVRHWGESLVDPEDRAEQARTEYLLTGHLVALIGTGVREALSHPVRLVRALPALLRLIRAARGRIVAHMGYLLQAIRLRHRCTELGIDHVHAHFSTNAAAVAMLCRLMGGPSYSFTVHGPDELVDPAANGIAEKARHARNIIAISDYCRGRLIDTLPSALWGCVIVIPCGLDLGPQNPPRNGEGDRSKSNGGACGTVAHAPPPSFGWPPSPSEIGEELETAYNLLCVGRLCPQKGQVEIPAAVAALIERFPYLHIDLIGDGEDRSAIAQRAAAMGVTDHLTLHGWCSNDAVRSMLQGARALLLPSHAEGLPIVIMEAFAMGRPVITTRIAGIPELVDESCGWLFDAGSADGLRHAIADALAADPVQLALMGAEGRRRIEDRHDLRTIAPRLIALFGDAGPS